MRLPQASQGETQRESKRDQKEERDRRGYDREMEKESERRSQRAGDRCTEKERGPQTRGVSASLPHPGLAMTLGGHPTTRKEALGLHLITSSRP